MERICSRCGGSSFHYNRSRMRMECDVCGTPASDPQQEQQLMQFDRACSQAMGHLTAGNWDEALQLLQPLLHQHPTEKRLYLAVLRAATKDFTDIAMANAASRHIASEAWDRLVRLNGVTGAMIRYGRQRYALHRRELLRQRTKLLAWIFAAALCSLLAGIFLETGHGFLSVLCVGGLVGCLYRISHSQPICVIQQLLCAIPGDQHNPFL